MNEDRPMSAFAGIAASLALPGRSGAEPRMRDAAQGAVDRPRIEAVPKGKRWWAIIPGLTLLLALLASSLPAAAQVSIQIAIPGISIGINQPVYPQLVAVPGYPVYYDPNSAANYFFYDGLYWVFEGDNWYASSWYNGPWALVGPQYVPVFLLRIPVRYYRQPPTYFRAWGPDGPPRWGEHWGHDWEREHSGWDRWDRHSAPPPAPLPVYQREYSGKRYPQQVEQQQALRNQNYRYQPRDAVVKQVHQAEAASRPSPQATPAPQQSNDKREQPERGKQQQQPQQQQAQPASRPAPQATPAPQQSNDKREQPEKGKQQQQPQQQQAQPASRPAPQATPAPQQSNDKREQPEKGKQQQQQQQQAQPASRPAPQATPAPQQSNDKREQPDKGKQQQQQAQPASRPAPQASQGKAEPQRQDARAPEQDKGHPGKNEPEPKGNPAQAKGQDRGQEHDNK